MQVKLGFNTNSSSCHSVIMLKKYEVGKYKDVLNLEDYGKCPYDLGHMDFKGRKDVRISDREYSMECGRENFWCDWFLLASPKWKTRYLAAQVNGYLKNKCKSSKIANLATQAIFGYDQNGTVDHQSQIMFPSPYSIGTDRNDIDQGIDIQFLKELNELFRKDNIVITGGRDDSYEERPSDFPYGSNIPLINFMNSECDYYNNDNNDMKDGKLLSRKDDRYNYWTLFNQKTGGKLRIDLGDMDREFTKSSLPEIVDIKITDNCTANCPFCYQGSTSNGKIANLEILKIISSRLYDMKVFEVALGGGEPTTHPYFLEILNYLVDDNIVVNFSTRNYDFLVNGGDKLKRTLELIKGIGISVSSMADIEKVEPFLDGKKSNRFKLHIVAGVFPTKELKYVFNTYPCVVLAPKNVGRGSDFKYEDYHDKLEKIILKNDLCGNVSFDTMLIKEFRKHLDSRFVDQEEGKFSFYIDAVDGYMAKCSYDFTPTAMSIFQQDNVISTERILKEYQRY